MENGSRSSQAEKKLSTTFHSSHPQAPLTWIRLLPQSATMMFPLESTATPVGALNCPLPSPCEPNLKRNSPSALYTWWGKGLGTGDLTSGRGQGLEGGVKLQGEFPDLQLRPEILFRHHTQYPTAHQTFLLMLPWESGISHLSISILLPPCCHGLFSAGQETIEHIPDSDSSLFLIYILLYLCQGPGSHHFSSRSLPLALP